MRILRTVLQILILWLFYFVGSWIVQITGLVIPGSIVGLILLWIALALKWVDLRWVADGANFLIAFLTLFFIPSTVGVIQYPELLSVPGMLLVTAVFLSTLIAFVLTGKLSVRIERKEGENKHV
jgi:holin-like protein